MAACLHIIHQIFMEIVCCCWPRPIMLVQGVALSNEKNQSFFNGTHPPIYRKTRPKLRLRPREHTRMTQIIIWFLQFHKNNKRVLWTWESCGLKPYVFLIQNAWRPSRVNHTFLLSKLREHCLQIKTKNPKKCWNWLWGHPLPMQPTSFF